MRQIALISLLALPLFAGFFPSTVDTSISATGKNSVSLSSSFPVKGMSGVVVHNYSNGLEAIIGYIVQTDTQGHAKQINKSITHHDKLPSIKTAIALGDSVIGGYLYNNVLLLAPDADTYAKITTSHNKKWIHPDLYALFLSQEGEATPSKKNLAAFAKAYQVGLIYIVKNGSATLLDPISGNIVGEKTMTGLPSKAQFPFYMRFDEIQTGWFSKSAKGDYYKSMEKI